MKMRVHDSRKPQAHCGPGRCCRRFLQTHWQTYAFPLRVRNHQSQFITYINPTITPADESRRTELQLAAAPHEAMQVLSRPNLYDADGRLYVKGVTLPELQQWFSSQGEKPSRAEQVWRWVYGNGGGGGRSGSAATAATGLAKPCANASAGPSGRSSGRSSTSTSSEAQRGEGGGGGGPSGRSSSSVRPRHSSSSSSTGSSGGSARGNGVVGAREGSSPGRAAEGGFEAAGRPTAADGGGGAGGGGGGQELFGGGLRRLEDAAEPSVGGFSGAFVQRFSSQLSLDGGIELLEVTTAMDGTRKLVFSVKGGKATGGRIETVLIPWYRDYDPRVGRQEQPRYTLCVSSQVGCAMNCQFCFTGRRGLLGNLSTAQIIEQVLVAQKLLEGLDAASQPSPHPRAPFPALVPTCSSGLEGPQPPPPRLAAVPITNIVFMGMGEPLDNCTAVFAAIDIMTHRRGLGISASRITLSTVGLLPQLQQFLDRYGPPPPATTTPSTTVSTVSTTTSPATVSNPIPPSLPPPPSSSPSSLQPLPPPPRVSLAVSIHAGTDEMRTALVPSNSRLSFSSSTTSAAPSPSHLPPSPSATPSPLPPLPAATPAAVPLPPSLDSAGAATAAAAATAEGVALVRLGAANAAVGASAADGGDGDRGGGGAVGSLRGLAALCSVLLRHYPRTNRRPLKAGRYVLFEYTMLGGVNDRPQDAAALLATTAGIECSFNLIMFNPFPGSLYVPSSRERVDEFRRVLRAGGRMVHVRQSKGDSDMAACGQLGNVGTQQHREGGRSSSRPAKVLPEAAARAAAAAAVA